MPDFANLLSLFVDPQRLPQEVEPNFYRALYPDLGRMRDDELRAHFINYGRQDGRCASPAAHRRGFVAAIPSNKRVLEIGPFTAPALRGQHVRYFDVLDREGLIARAREHRYPIVDPPEIDFVSPTGDLSIVTEKFDSVFSSHCLEHSPDLFAHLKNIAALLTRGGRYFAIIPDKRYCFDQPFEASALDEMIEAHAQRRQVHTREKVLINVSETTHNDAVMHWQGQHDDPRLHEREHRREVAEALLAQANGGYVDTHAWFFTPDTFRSTMTQASAAGLIPFTVERVYDTLKDSNEFNAVLRRKD